MTEQRSGRSGRAGRGSTEAERFEAERLQKMAQVQLSADIDFLLQHPQFKRYMRRLLERAGVMRSVFTGNSQTYYNSGKQDFGTEVWASLAEVDKKAALELLLPETREAMNND